MKFLAILLSCFNLYIGIRYLLNAVGILQTSKYAHSTDIAFSVIFLGLVVAAFYYVFGKQQNGLGLLLSIGPWVLGLLFLLFSVIFEDHK